MRSILFFFSIVSLALAQTPVPPSERFQRFDANGDGKLSQQELAAPRLFERFDKDQDGFLTLEELAGLRRMAQTPALEVKGEFEPRPHPEAKAAAMDPEVLGQIDVVLQKHVAANQISGVVALLAKEGRIGYFEAFGHRDIESEAPMPKDALFRIYSMTKPVVATAAMALWEEGAFTFDEPIHKHLPEWKDVRVQAKGEESVLADKPITPRQLMTHASGLYYGVWGSGGPREDLTLAEFSEYLATKPLKFEPGTDYSYGHSTDILGRYIEAVAGQPLDVLLRERLFEPLGMTDTDFWVKDPADAERIAQMYMRQGASLSRGRDSADLLEKPTLMMGGQGLVSSTRDYARFCQMLLNGGELDGNRVLQPETVEEIFKNHLADIGKVYGLGGIVDGKGSYSWGGAAGTKFCVDRTTQTYGVFMVQTQRYRAPAYNAFRPLALQALSAE